MACMTIFAPTMLVATTALARAIGYEEPFSWQEGNTDHGPLRMNWVVVTDKDGHRELAMQWAPSVCDRRCALEPRL